MFQMAFQLDRRANTRLEETHLPDNGDILGTAADP
jgi:hypothetical protein